MNWLFALYPFEQKTIIFHKEGREKENLDHLQISPLFLISRSHKESITVIPGSAFFQLLTQQYILFAILINKQFIFMRPTHILAVPSMLKTMNPHFSHQKYVLCHQGQDIVGVVSVMAHPTAIKMPIYVYGWIPQFGFLLAILTIFSIERIFWGR